MSAYDECCKAAASMGQALRWMIRQDAREVGLDILPSMPSIYVHDGGFTERHDFPAEDLRVLDPGEAEYIAEREKIR